MYIDICKRNLGELIEENPKTIVDKACESTIQPLLVYDQWCFNNVYNLQDRVDIFQDIKTISSDNNTLKQRSFVARDTV